MHNVALYASYYVILISFFPCQFINLFIFVGGDKISGSMDCGQCFHVAVS